MKIVIAPDSYKESLSAMAVANEIEAGFREIFPDADYLKVPVADGGEGTVQAMIDASGGRLLDGAGKDLAPGGGALATLARIDLSALDARIADCVFDVACDVSNPLVGPQGASHIFGPQKGATPEMIELLDAGLRHYADVIARDLERPVADVPGAGAGGGIGAAMLVFLGGRLRPGSEIVTAAVGLDAAVANADLIVTGEGRIDSQTIHGKTPVGVARVAQRHGKPVIAIAGCLAPGAAAVHAHGIAAVFGAVSRPCTVEQALADAARNVRVSARNIAAVLRLGSKLGL